MIYKKEKSFWAIIELNDGTYQGHGEIKPPLVLTTMHKVLEFETTEDYESRCLELGIELIEEL